MTTYTDVLAGSVVQPANVSQSTLNMATDQTLVWPVPRICDLINATGTTKIILPDATLASVGQDLLFNNLSANSVTVVADDGITVVATVTAGQVKYVYLDDNTTTNGSWKIVTMGGSVSAADAAALQGMGVFAIGTTLNSAINVEAVTTDFTVDQTTDRAKLFVWNGPGGTISLPAAATVGANFFFMLRNDGSGTVTVNPNGAETINNNLTFGMPQGGNSAIIVCDGAEWYTVGFGQNVNYGYSATTVSVTGVVSTPTTMASLGWNSQPFITISGTLGLNLELTLPDAAGLYVITNSVTMGLFTLTIKTLTGSGYSMSAGETMVLFSDGSNLKPGTDPTPTEAIAAAVAFAIALG